MSPLIQPYNSQRFQKIFFLSILIGFPFLFLYLTQPLGLFMMKSQSTKVLLILVLSLSFSSLQLLQIAYLKKVKKLTPSKVLRLNWAVGILAVIISMLVIFLLHPYMFKKNAFLFLLTVVSIIGVFQILSFYLLKPFYKTYLPMERVDGAPKIILIKDNKTSLRLKVDDILFIKSDGNYIEVHTSAGKHLLRSSIKRVLEDHPGTSLRRCHKSYIINLSKVKTIQGNSKGYEILLEGAEFPIPLSRNLGKEFKEELFG